MTSQKHDSPAAPSAEDREALASAIGEAVHTALRKGCDSDASVRAWAAINDLPDHEWSEVLEWAVDAVLAVRGAASPTVTAEVSRG